MSGAPWDGQDDEDCGVDCDSCESDRRGPHDLGSATPRRETEKELLVQMDETGEQLWVPKSCIHDNSECYSMKSGGGRLVVLRSFGKFYGLAGLRLGFVVAGEPVIAAVRAAFGDWPVSGAAIAAGRAAYADTGWRTRTRARLVRDAARLDRLLAEAGLDILGGTPLFRLAAAPHAQSLFDRLARAGILCRPFDQHPTWLRFGLPGPPAAWARLKAALAGAAS